eukprot:gene13012-3516_t
MRPLEETTSPELWRVWVYDACIAVRSIEPENMVTLAQHMMEHPEQCPPLIAARNLVNGLLTIQKNITLCSIEALDKICALEDLVDGYPNLSAIDKLRPPQKLTNSVGALAYSASPPGPAPACSAPSVHNLLYTFLMVRKINELATSQDPPDGAHIAHVADAALMATVVTYEGLSHWRATVLAGEDAEEDEEEELEEQLQAFMEVATDTLPPPFLQHLEHFRSIDAIPQAILHVYEGYTSQGDDVRDATTTPEQARTPRGESQEASPSYVAPPPSGAQPRKDVIDLLGGSPQLGD